MLEVKVKGRASTKGNGAFETPTDEKNILKMREHTGDVAPKTRNIQRVLVPTDFSRSSQAGVRYALNAARESGAEVIVYHVITTKAIVAFGRVRKERAPVGNRFYGLIDTYSLRLRRFVEKILGGAGSGVKVRAKVEFGTPEKNIVKVAADEKADLIIMSTRRKSRWARWLSSGVTENVSRLAPCPVLIVPPEFASAAQESVYQQVA